MSSRSLFVLSALALGLAACRDVPTDPATAGGPTGPTFAISDGAHAGNPHVFFLPPLVPDPSRHFSAAFDNTLDVTITICIWEIGPGQCGAVLRTFTANTDPAVRVGDGFYGVPWHLARDLEQYPLGPGEVYRMRVLVGSREVAHGDLQIVGRGEEWKDIRNDEYIPVRKERTLPIRVRIEKGWEAYGVVKGPEAGAVHTCRLTTAGAAWCWGWGYFGQLGDGTFYTSDPYGSATLVPVNGGHAFVTLSAGGYHTCGLTAAGAAWCWGRGDNGQLGDGTIYASPPNGSAVPVAVTGGHTFVALTAGELYTCGITSNGAAYCWGVNWSGQLGDGTIALNPPFGTATPVAVTGGLTFSALTAGRNHTCGLTPTGAAWCWGANVYGQLGNGDNSPNRPDVTPVPIAVTGGLAFASLTAGDYHTCGITPLGAGYCWGSGNYGQAGTGSFGGVWGDAVPAPVAGGLTFSTIAAGDLYTCGLTSTGAGYCWGLGIGGQRGDGTTTLAVPAPVGVTGGLTFASLSVGAAHSCGLAAGGTAYCWGSGGYGELGDGLFYIIDPWGSPTPVAVHDPPGGW